jgi:hypothetical protein
MTSERPTETADPDVQVIGEPSYVRHESFGNAGGSSNLFAGYSPWTSLTLCVVVTATIVGVSGVFPKMYLPAMLLGMLGGVLLYQFVRTVVVRSGFRTCRIPPARRLQREGAGAVSPELHHVSGESSRKVER